MEKRKHRSMLNAQELIFIQKAIQTRDYEFTPYSMGRIITRGITSYEVRKAILDGEVVEIHFIDEDVRVLVRGQANKTRRDTCVVLDLGKKSIITAYQNDSLDHHRSLKTDNYNPDLDIFTLIRQYLD